MPAGGTPARGYRCSRPLFASPRLLSKSSQSSSLAKCREGMGLGVQGSRVGFQDSGFEFEGAGVGF